ncbi:hypothetical protein PINS_up001947 [Pythium insidiosum]|nr:hypothetical protein PINS_up001947 [Pythium insidiosum]
MLLQKEVMVLPLILTVDGTLRLELDSSGEVSMPAMMRVLQILVMEKASLSAALRASSTIAVPGGTGLYQITNGERLSIKQELVRACERRLETLRAQRVACSNAKRGAIFQLFFDTQMSVLSSIIKCQQKDM